jgi:hypothetical protein
LRFARLTSGDSRTGSGTSGYFHPTPAANWQARRTLGRQVVATTAAQRCHRRSVSSVVNSPTNPVSCDVIPTMAAVGAVYIRRLPARLRSGVLPAWSTMVFVAETALRQAVEDLLERFRDTQPHAATVFGDLGL